MPRSPGAPARESIRERRSARDVVMARLVKRAKRFPDLPLDPLDTSDLDVRDGALARAIDHAIAKRWLTLSALIQSRLDRPWERVQPELQAILLTAAAQLFLLDRIPDHAAVDHAVQWTKRQVRVKAAGFVNAVLRALISLRGEKSTPTLASGAPRRELERDELPLGDGRILKLAEPIFGEDQLTRLCQQTSHGSALVADWWKTLGPPATYALCLHDCVEPPIIVAGVGGNPPANEHLLPHASPGFSVFSGTHAQLLEMLAANPELRVQDPATARPVQATRSLKPGLVVDLCAGRGTKTIQLASLHPAACIIASDTDRDRVESLRARFAGSARVTVIEGRQWLDYANAADLLVLDVPCSNTGVLARRVEAKYRFGEEQLRELVTLQRQIIADSLALKAPGGRLLYSTCSIDRRENHEQTEWLMKWHGLAIEGEELTMPSGGPGEAASSYHDGGYWALLR